MVHVTFSDWRMSCSGLPSMTMMSASLPASSEPMSRSMPRRLRAVGRGAAQRLERREPALHEHPELPVQPQALALAVRARVDEDAVPVEARRDLRLVEVVALVVGRHRAAARARVEDERAARTSRAAGSPTRWSSRTSTPRPKSPPYADEERRRVADLARRPERVDVRVDVGHRDRVLDRRVPVDDHRHVHLEERAALGHDHHADLARGRQDLLALLAARLVVALDARSRRPPSAGAGARARRRASRSRP